MLDTACAKAVIHKCNGFARSPVYFACQQNRPDCIPLLVSDKRDVDDKIGGDRKSRIPIIIAASKGHTTCLKLLLSFGADAGIKDSQDLSTLELAVETSWQPACNCALSKRSECCVGCSGVNDYVPSCSAQDLYNSYSQTV